MDQVLKCQRCDAHSGLAADRFRLLVFVSPGHDLQQASRLCTKRETTSNPCRRPLYLTLSKQTLVARITTTGQALNLGVI